MSLHTSQVPKDNIVFETEFSSDGSARFKKLRGVRWRMDLGILPHSSSPSIDDLRRVTADSRRRYASLRRQHLVDPQIPKDGNSSPVMDNPLSQNPDSIWGRFFKNAELERMVDQDLTRLYPERGSYFQTSECQGILRRVLLLWCLRHPQYGYRQGMHELLAPLLYVLHVDIEHLSEVRELHENHFSDKFDGFAFHENDLSYKFDFKKFSQSEGIAKSSFKVSGLDELDAELQAIVLLTDAYGAEGELGIVISEKFMEHDAYSMFDALMNGAGGVVAMEKFSSPSAFVSSQTGLPPIIEASSALYHLLSIVDSSLHSHLVQLRVEPQYFALRWLRVLFGREFSLEDLLLIWDEIFACENGMDEKTSNPGVLGSARGAFINAFAVSMILRLRSSLLATENATICLQRLLNFSNDASLEKLVEKARSLQTLAVKANHLNSIIHPGLYDGSFSLSLDSASSVSPLTVVPESYWEEKWRDFHKDMEHKHGSAEKETPNQRNGWSERVRVRLSRTESAPTPLKKAGRTRLLPNPSVRRNLLKDLEKQLGLDKEDKRDSHMSEDENKQDASSENSSKVLSDSRSEVNSFDVSSPLLDNTESESSIDLPSVDCQESPSITVSDSFIVFSSKCTENRDLEHKHGSAEKKTPNYRNGWSERVRVRLSRTESAPTPLKKEGSTKFFSNPSVRRNLLKDLELQLGLNEDKEDKSGNRHTCHWDTSENSSKILSDSLSEVNSFDVSSSLLVNTESESSSNLPSNEPVLFIDCQESPPIPISDSVSVLASKCTENQDLSGKSAKIMERKPLSSKFQWLWMLGRNGEEGTSEKKVLYEKAESCNGGNDREKNKVAGSSTTDECDCPSRASKEEKVDQNLMVNLRNISHSMLENIQVIESFFPPDHHRNQPENFSKNGLVGKGQVTAMAALKELRKISNLLSEIHH